jgi:hypothetical protein
MVILLEGAPRKKSFIQKLGLGVNEGLNKLSSMQEQKKSEELKFQREIQLAQEKEKAKYQNKLDMLKGLGFDVSGKGKDLGGNQPEGPSRVDQLKGVNNALEGNEGPEENPNEFSVGVPKLPNSPDKIKLASLVDPNLSRQMQKENDMAIEEARHQEESYRKNREYQRKVKEASPEFQREKHLTQEQAKADTKYHNELQAASKLHSQKMKTLNNLEKLNKKDVTGKPFEKLLEKSGLVSLTSEGRREFAADVKTLITDIRSILGSQFTGFEFQTILNAYPSPDFSQEANDAIIKNLKEFEDIRDQEFKIENQLIKENNGKIPENLQSKVNERLQDYAISKLPEIKANTYQIMKEEYGVSPGKILMFTPDGEPLEVSPDKIEYAESIGAKMFP